MAADQTATNADGEEILGGALDSALLFRILSYVWPYRLVVGAALAVLPLVTFLEIAQVEIIGKAIDEHIAIGKVQGLDRLGLLFVGVLLAHYGLLFAQVYLTQLLGQRAMADLRRQLYSHVMGLSQNFFDTRPVGRLMTRLTSDIEALNEMFASGLVNLVADLIKLVAILVTIFVIDWELALFSMISAPLLFAIAAFFRKRVRNAFRMVRTRMSHLNVFLQEHLSGIKVVQAFAREAHVARLFDGRNRAYRAASAQAISADAALYAIVEAVGTFALAGLLWHGGGRIFAGTLTLGVLWKFLEYLQKFFAPIRDLSTKYTVMQQAMASAERVFGLLDTQAPDAPTSFQIQSPRTPAKPTQALIRFEGVQFGYKADTPVIHSLDLHINAGETVAVVGASGAGKSTLIKLLSRTHDPQVGTIAIDGRNIRSIEPEVLRRRIVTIGQDPFLFSGTLREAIGLGRSTDAAILRAAARTGADNVLRTRAAGLDALVEPRGVNFSAGERQLIALARALCSEPEVLVLDEATANVDPEAERLLEKGTAEVMRSNTALVIAHRLSTIRRADRIVVMEQGRIVEQGTHDQLLEQRGTFARLYERQMGQRLGDAPSAHPSC